MECAGQGKANLVEEILKKSRRGKPLVTAVEYDPNGYTAFGRVARESPAPLVRATLIALQKFGGDVNQKCRTGFTPIQEAILCRSDPAATVSALLRVEQNTFQNTNFTIMLIKYIFPFIVKQSASHFKSSICVKNMFDFLQLFLFFTYTINFRPFAHKFQAFLVNVHYPTFYAFLLFSSKIKMVYGKLSRTIFTCIIQQSNNNGTKYRTFGINYKMAPSKKLMSFMCAFLTSY